MTYKSTTTLVFPCSVPAAWAYAASAKSRGEVVVASSSLAHDRNAMRFDKWIYLPMVFAEDFAACLDAVITEHGIDRIYSPVSAAYWGIKNLSDKGLVRVPLIGEMPLLQHAREHAELMQRARDGLKLIDDVSGGRSALSPLQVAAVLQKAMSFFGESDETKIAAMLGILPDVPKGDVVEIGVLTGRSIAVLEMMARFHDIGPVLGIDPWSHEPSIQHEAAHVPRMMEFWQPTVPFETFVIQSIPIARERAFNYLPTTSRDGHAKWSGERQVRSTEFGVTNYSGRIALLHIDGNHDYTAVREDVQLWLPHLASGGWLILDDYYWLHGDGPRRVGDELLTTRWEDISRCFVCGRALFVQLSPLAG